MTKILNEKITKITIEYDDRNETLSDADSIKAFQSTLGSVYIRTSDPEHKKVLDWQVEPKNGKY